MCGHVRNFVKQEQTDGQTESREKQVNLMVQYVCHYLDGIMLSFWCRRKLFVECLFVIKILNRQLIELH